MRRDSDDNVAEILLRRTPSARERRANPLWTASAVLTVAALLSVESPLSLIPVGLAASAALCMFLARLVED